MTLNEGYFCFAAAERLYREVADLAPLSMRRDLIASADRCKKAEEDVRSWEPKEGK